MLNLNAGQKAYVTKMRNKVAAEAPKTKFCPKCERNRKTEFFGIRTFSEKGKPTRFSLQSYCTDCRNESPARKKVAKKVKAAKAKVTQPAENVVLAAPENAAPAIILPAPEAPAPVVEVAPAPAPENITF